MLLSLKRGVEAQWESKNPLLAALSGVRMCICVSLKGRLSCAVLPLCHKRSHVACSFPLVSLIERLLAKEASNYCLFRLMTSGS